MGILEDNAVKRTGLLAKAQNLITSVREASRDMTNTEEKSVESWFAEIEKIDAYAASMKSSMATMEKLTSFGAPDPNDSDRERYGAAGYDATAVKVGLTSALRQKGSYGYNMPLSKATITAGSVTLPSNGSFVSDTPPGDSVVALRELFQQQEAAAATVRYYRLGLGSGADVVAEGGLKPELNADIEAVDAALQKLAVTFSYTDELSEDAEFLVSYIGREATRAILRRENELITAAFNTAPGTLTSTGTRAQVIDVIAGAIGAAQATNGIAPARLIANPLDVAEIRTLKTSGSGEYQVDPLGAAPAGVHGVPLTATPAIPSGTMYLASPGVGVFYTRGTLRIESGFTGDDWTHNRVTTRVEERVLPAIVRPSLLTKITLTA